MTGAAGRSAPPALDPDTPRYHVTGERNWINDPNGPLHHNGVYHLFFQANVHAPEWGPPSWGHVSSTDLVHWRRHPDALAPEPGRADADGCWSGCARIVDGRPVLYYTGVVGDGDDRVEAVCRATGSADLTAWAKDPDGPLVAGPPDGLDSGYHRDPFLWHDGREWQLILGSGTTSGERHGTVLRYSSHDAATWHYRGEFFAAPREAGGIDLGEHWECPQLLDLGDLTVLLLSCQDPKAPRPLLHTVAYTGRITGGAFHAHGPPHLFDHGDALYAPAAAVDAAGRTLVWGWVQEPLSEHDRARAAKVGALTLPRVVDTDKAGLRVRPAPELEGLRTGLLRSGPVPDPAGARGSVLCPAARQMEIEVAVEQPRGRYGVRVELSPDGTRALTVAVDAGAVTVTGPAPDEGCRAPLDAAGPAALRIYLDGSVVEVFAGDRVALTRRIHTTGPALGAVRAFAAHDGTRMDCSVWRLSATAVDEAPGGAADT
ncbi:glycoside hydrolase family 32 protein [Nocardiopsis aegyptia]|uniref:glycoside hydrolase family 32 protein n=1 Tax=Nocardiopsis aegyptia TaxID=220378 RepID=UPI00366C56D5